MTRLFIILLLLWLSSWSRGEVKVSCLVLEPGDSPSRQAFYRQPVRIWGDNYLVKPDEYHALLTLVNGKCLFAFHLHGSLGTDGPANVQLGMVRPSHFNWYAGNFLSVFQDGKSQTGGGFRLLEASSSLDGGFALLEYQGPGGGQLRLELAEDDDKLQLTFTPRCRTLPCQATLTAYPGAYGTPELRQRLLLTANRIADSNEMLLRADECWALFADKYYDCAKGQGDGCCAFLFNPNNTSRALLKTDRYSCQAILDYIPGKDIHLILWDLKGWSCQQAQEYLNSLKIELE
jgi:hypothetical protein